MDGLLSGRHAAGMPGKPPYGPPNRIRQLRDLRGITQEALAAHLGIGVPAMSKIENRRIRLMPEYILPIARFLDVHPGELFEPLPGRDDPVIQEALEIIRKADADTARYWLDGGHRLVEGPPQPTPARKKKAPTPR